MSSVTVFKNVKSSRLKFRSKDGIPGSHIYKYERDDITENREDYQIAICQDGKFAVTFDTENLRIRILENTDHRPFEIVKKETNQQISNKSDKKFDTTIAYFKINDDLDIEKFYDTDFSPPDGPQQEICKEISSMNGEDDHEVTEKETVIKKPDRVRKQWSFDISNIQENIEGNFIFVAVSCINVERDMKGPRSSDEPYEYPRISKDIGDIEANISDVKNKVTIIYRLKLTREKKIKDGNYFLDSVTYYYYSDEVSGICRFIQDFPISSKTEEDRNYLKRFIILNFHGIYNFEFNFNKGFKFGEKLNYPKSFRNELDYWFRGKNCMERLLKCIYDKYFLATLYKNDVQLLEVYDLVTMDLETVAKNVESKDKRVRIFQFNVFSVSKLQLCFSRGNNRVKLYYIENGLQVASRRFEELEEIYSLEFIESDEKLLIIGKNSENQDDELRVIIWDPYRTGEVEIVVDIPMRKDRLDGTSGNVLYVNEKGDVASVLERIDSERIYPEIVYLDVNLSKKYCKSPIDDRLDKNHIMYLDKDDFKTIVHEKEPWVLDEYKRKSYFLFQDDVRTLQLIIGRSTVQIWHKVHYDPDDKNKAKDDLPNKGEPFLEYIWANGIPVNQERNETRIRIEEFKYVKDSSNDESNDMFMNDFYLKVYWYERFNEKGNKDIKKKGDYDVMKEKENEEIRDLIVDKVKVSGELMERKEKIIRRKDIFEQASAVKNACKALGHLNKRYKYKFLANNYVKVHKYEEIITYTQHIVWRFVKYKPEQFKLLDVRYNAMKDLILGDCDNLIKFILFGGSHANNNHNCKVKIDEKIEKYKEKQRDIRKERERKNVRHVPGNVTWPGETFLNDDDLVQVYDKVKDHEEIRPENIMELAIYHCKGRELKDTIVVAYLLEYYSKHATDNVGYMSTVSKAIPLLFKYNYDEHVKKLFRKECFADQDHFSARDPYEIIPKEYLARRNHNIKFRAFRPSVELESDKKYFLYSLIWKSFQFVKDFIIGFIEDFDNNLGKSPLALRVVPLPGFTINNIPKNKTEYSLTRLIINGLWFLFIPRWYQISPNDKNKLSPFSRMILYENNDDIYDNPSTEAIIDFRWRKAENFFFYLFLRFLIFASCFTTVSVAYMDRSNSIRIDFLLASIFIFYYMAIYLLATETIQAHYRGPRNYFGDVFNVFDITSILLSVIVMTVMLKDFHPSNGFGSIESVGLEYLTAISFAFLFLWVEFVMYLRLISQIAIYIYYVIIIFKTVFPFILFILIAVFALATAVFIILRNPEHIDINTNTLSGIATNILTNSTLNITLHNEYDLKSSSDNPFSSLPSAMKAAYSWVNGDFVSKDIFNFWAIDIYSSLASLFLVTILQNMLIAFMTGVYEEAATKGRQTLLRYRANHIADYEALHHIHLWGPQPEPKHIYYIGQSKNFEEWYDIRKGDQGEIYKDFEEKSTFTSYNFECTNYDNYSIWKYYDNNNNFIEEIENKIKEVEELKIRMDDNIKKLLEKLRDQLP